MRKMWMWLQSRKASKRLQVLLPKLQSSEEKEEVTMKKLTPKQKKIAGAAAPKDKITGADFKALKKKAK